MIISGGSCRRRSWLGKAVIDGGQVLHQFGLRIHVVPVEQQGGEVRVLMVHFKEEPHVVNPGQEEGHDLRCKTGVGLEGSHGLGTSLKVMEWYSVVAYR